MCTSFKAMSSRREESQEDAEKWTNKNVKRDLRISINSL